MQAGRHYPFSQTLKWTWGYVVRFALIATPPVLAYQLLGWHWLAIPWLPIALVGTAVAFIIGFKNNASYDRTWEARKIWGGIVNASRSWASQVKSYVTNQFANSPVSEDTLHEIHRRLVYRQIAWLTALRHQLRQPRPWESNTQVKADIEYSKNYVVIPEYESELNEDMAPFLPVSELVRVMNKQNHATHIIDLQSQDLMRLRQDGLIEDFRHMELHKTLDTLYTLQGQCERVKNFPFPRQYATMNILFVWLFIGLLPFGLLQEFAQLGEHFVWLTIPCTVLVAWVFHTMERIGEATENPFSGGANDVPISALSRTIEIDLRDMLDEPNLPAPIEPVNMILP